MKDTASLKIMPPSLGVAYSQGLVDLGIRSLSLLAPVWKRFEGSSGPCGIEGASVGAASPSNLFLPLPADRAPSQVVFLRAAPINHHVEISISDSAFQGSQAKQDGSGTCQVNS